MLLFEFQENQASHTKETEYKQHLLAKSIPKQSKQQMHAKILSFVILIAEIIVLH